MLGHKRNASMAAADANPEKKAKGSDEDKEEVNVSAEDILRLMPPKGLLDFVTILLADEAMGPVIKQQLFTTSPADYVLQYALTASMKESDAIAKEAQQAIDQILHNAFDHNKGWANTGDWPRALEPFLPRLEALRQRGHLADGPKLAWEAALVVGEACALPEDARYDEGGEEDCDKFHERLDDILVQICRDHFASGELEWLRDGRKEEVEKLAGWSTMEIYEGPHAGGHPCDYRYQKVQSYLQEMASEA